MDEGGYASARDAAFWRATLAGAPAGIALSTDTRGDGSAIATAVVPPDGAAAFAGLGRELGATLWVTVLAGLAVLLYRYSGQTDLVVDGAPSAASAAQPQRIRLDPAGPFADAVRRTLATVNEAAAHPGVPPGGFPASNVRFGVDAGATADLHVRYAESVAGLALTVRSPGGRFEPAALERLAANFAALVGSIVDAPSLPVAQFNVPAPAERQRLLAEWNPAPRPSMAASTLPERFAEQAAARPATTAVVDGGTVWTYGELDARADALAGRLLAHGIGHEELVAVDAGRGAAAILAMLAILKAGGAYLPLDAATPPDGRAAILAAAGVRLLLGRGPGTAAANGITRLDLDMLDLRPGAPPAPVLSPQPDDLAYVMFTSGSTGRAKGVMIGQRGIVNLVTCSPALAIAPGDVVAQMASIAFDGATYEIWGALLNGATLAIVSRETMLDAAALAAFLRAAHVSVAFLTPALLRHVVREEPAAFATLRLLVAGGEVLDPAVTTALFAHGPPGRLLNGYGPSETTTFATTHDVRPSENGPIPIGVPLTNVQTYVLDAARSPVPIGVRGELHIGGLGLARGYLNDPELTARRFVAHPFSTDPAARLYATGDIVRQRSDGTLEFFGRADRQVKVRGFRIELDDIEAAINAQPCVDGAAVVFEHRDGADGRLTAFIADTARPPRGAAAWRTALGAQLPDRMLPARYVNVPAIPLNSNGKTDLAALAQLAGHTPASARVSPAASIPDDERTARERGVMRIFTDVLGVAPGGRHDDFFVLGGNSLLAARAIARIRERFGVEVRLHDFFAAPTPLALAERIASAPPRAVRPIRAAAPSEVAALSDAEIDALLDEALRE